MHAPSRLAAAVLAVSVTGFGGVAAAAPSGTGAPDVPENAAAARQLSVQRQAGELFAAAERHVISTVAGCRPVPPEQLGGTGVIHGAPSQAVLDALAPLRRPASAGDAVPAGAHPVAALVGSTYVDDIRGATAANGQQFLIVVGRGVSAPTLPGLPCVDAIRARLVQRLAGKPKAVRTEALRIAGRFHDTVAQQALLPTAPQDGIYLFTRASPQDGSGGGAGGGGVAIADFLERGMFISTGDMRTGATTRIYGLVPDGVAAVTLEFPKTVSHGSYDTPTAYPRAYTRTVRVQENVLSVAIPRPARDGLPSRMVWRDAAGNVLRVVAGVGAA